MVNSVKWDGAYERSNQQGQRWERGLNRYIICYGSSLGILILIHTYFPINSLTNFVLFY